MPWTVWSSLGEQQEDVGDRAGMPQEGSQEEGQGRTGREHGRLDVTVRLGKRRLD